MLAAYDGNKKLELIGHVRICLIPSKDNSVWLESGKIYALNYFLSIHCITLCSFVSVIISPSCRGKGLGKLLMQQAEKYAKLYGNCPIALRHHMCCNIFQEDERGCLSFHRGRPRILRSMFHVRDFFHDFV